MKFQRLGLQQPEQRFNPLENPSVPLSADWQWISGGHDTEAAEAVSDFTAMQLSTVFSCVKILAESVASLPVQLFTKTATGKTLAQDNPLFHLLGCEPNNEMTAFSFYETMVAHMAVTGNSYSQIQRDSSDNPVALWPLQPRQTYAVRLPNGNLAYRTTDGGKERVINSEDVLHVPLTSWDGITGLSPILQCKRALGLSIAAEKMGSRLFASNATPQLALMTKTKVKPEDRQKIRNDWETLQTGSNQHRIAILDQDISLQKLSLTAEEAQFLETRQYQRADIGAIYRISSHMLGSEVRQTDANVESMNREFVTGTLRPYLSRIEAEIGRKLLPRTPGRPSQLSVSFDVSEMLRGDSAAQAAWATAGVSNGWLTGNDARRSQGLNEGGPELDVYRVPVNFQNAERLLTDTKAAPETVVPNAE